MQNLNNNRDGVDNAYNKCFLQDLCKQFFSTLFISNSEDEIINHMIKSGAPNKNRTVLLDLPYKGADVGIHPWTQYAVGQGIDFPNF